MTCKILKLIAQKLSKFIKIATINEITVNTLEIIGKA